MQNAHIIPHSLRIPSLVPSSPDYNVFINSHEPDVCFFARHLHNSLVSRGLRVFLDSIELQAGQSIPSQIKDTIKGASLIITIFSPNYAQSQRCLHELLLALLCKPTIFAKAYNCRLLHISVIIPTAAKASLLRWMPPNVAIATLRHCVTIATFGGSRRNSDALGHSVAIATSSSKRHNCDTLSKCRYCDTFL